jgi:hypothetical protein
MIDQLTLFDYAALDSETRIVVQQRTTEIKALMKRAASDIIEIGQKLIEVKSRLGHGRFGGWLVAEFDWSDRTARQFMLVADRFKSANFSDLQIAPSALYLLAAPSTPESAREEAIARAEEGETITHGLARGIIHDHREPAAPYPDEEDFLTAYEEQIAEAENESARRDAIRRQQMGNITASSESNEWYTPQWIIDLARETMGGIDLDPASCPDAQSVIQAEAYCTAGDDGFNQPWHGRVWLNPPYGASGEGAAGWAMKLIREYKLGQVTAAILLVKAAFGYNWFNDLWYTYPTCILRERVTFVSPIDGIARGPAKHATVLLYFGSDVAKFQSIFRPFGRVILPE